MDRRAWPFNSAEGRWSGFGPYYAMFPVQFVKSMVCKFAPQGGGVLDPFCGRGTVPFVAKATGRHSFGSDLNPVGWLFASVKTDPCRTPELVKRRLREIVQNVGPEDRIPDNEFQALAWSPEVLGFLKVARRELNWQGSRVDRTLMGILLVHLHAKLGNGVSNQMRQSKAMAPEYAIRWWKERSMLPPSINPEAYFSDRIEWRYGRGIVSGPDASILLGDSSANLDFVDGRYFDLLLTSPPYCGVTDYKYDNWIRLWLLGGPALPEGGVAQRYGNKTKYKKSMRDIFQKAANLLVDDGVACIRTDTREFTLNTTIETITDVMPHHVVYMRQEQPKRTQTSLYGDKSIKPGETDLLALRRDVRPPEGFTPLERSG